MDIRINGSLFTLLSERALLKHDEHLLLIADVHLGKAAHFRREGIPIPADAQLNDYHNLRQLLNKVQPARVAFLGDLFHSAYNSDWLNFCDLIGGFPQIKFVLVRGNHDIIDDRLFHDLCIKVVDRLEDEYFIFSHEPIGHESSGKTNIAGHIHPGYRLNGAGRQSVMAPCFYCLGQTVILPAFGVLTGLHAMEKRADATVYLALPGNVVRCP